MSLLKDVYEKDYFYLIYLPLIFIINKKYFAFSYWLKKKEDRPSEKEFVGKK